MVRQLMIGCVLLVPAATSWGQTGTHDLARGFDLAYNLDHEGAASFFEAAVAAAPDDPAPHRGLAVVSWLRILFLRGTMTVADYMGQVSPRNLELQAPTADLAATFLSHSLRAVELSEALVEAAPDDPEAHYQLGASLGLAASYTATVEGKILDALRPAKQAYAAHERVLELDPERKDAMLIVGSYQYLVSTLPLPMRLMARLVGFGAGKEEGVRLIREASRYDGETQTEAQFGLLLIYNREREYDAAQRVLRTLKRRFPRNRLVWLEAAATALRDDRPAVAAANLRSGFSMLESDERARMFGEDALWLYTRGTTRLRLEQDAASRADLLAAIDRDARLWVTGRAHLDLGRLADLAGDRTAASQLYGQARALCDDGRDRRGVDAAKRLQKRPFRRR
jgi:hypothetical protein